MDKNVENNGAMTKLRSGSVMVMLFTYGMFVFFCVFSLLLLASVLRSNLPISSITTSPTLATTIYSDNRSRMKLIRWVPQASTSSIQSAIYCDRSHYDYDQCTIKGPTVLNPPTSTFYSIGPTKPKFILEKIRPFPRKWENSTNLEVTLISSTSRPTCQIVHNATAIVFTIGKYTENIFHDFNDWLLPLFVTVQSRSLSNQDVVLVVGKSLESWWINKYGDIIRALCKHPIVDLDHETNTHCFNSATVGLVSHGLMTIKPHLLPNNTTLVDFHNFIGNAYNKVHHPIQKNRNDRPKLVILTRTGPVGRVILNQAQLKTEAENMGFDVTLFEPKPKSPLRKVHKLLSNTHVMVGVHGAGLTHLLFLRPGSVFIQIVPIGTDQVAELCYGSPSKEMGLDYMEYKVDIDESSLVYKYNKNDPIVADPKALQNVGWALFKKTYLDEQDVKLNLSRFREYLKMAYKKEVSEFLNDGQSQK